MRSHLGARVAAASALAGLMLVAGLPAKATASGTYIPWPSLLPGLRIGPSGPPRPMPGCRHLSVRCVSRLVRQLHREWTAENARCDHRAVFSIAYERISRSIRDRLRDHTTFRYRHWFISVVQAFSDEYFATQRRYDAGKPVPGAWRIYYDETARGNDNAGQDLLLASNAHTNHDLPYAYASAGLLTRNGTSRKHDHDAVNEVNAGVFKGLAGFYAAHYDALFNTLNQTEPLDELSALQVVQLWRETAWRQAEALVAARDNPGLLQVIEGEIESTSVMWANLIRSVQVPGYRASRDAYCAAHHV
jgi:hypothetical protein